MRMGGGAVYYLLLILRLVLPFTDIVKSCFSLTAHFGAFFYFTVQVLLYFTVKLLLILPLLVQFYGNLLITVDP